MRSTVPKWLIEICTAIVMTACVAAENKPVLEGQPYAGWYMEHAGRGTFQPCGQPQQWRVTKSAELAARAKSFGLDQDTPIYARLKGTVHGDEIEVMRIEQFGSLTPVANCGLTGVVIPAAPSPGK